MIIFNGICYRDGYEENTLYDKKYSYSIFIYFYWVSHSRKVKVHVLNKYVLISRLLNWTNSSVQNLNVAEYETILKTSCLYEHIYLEDGSKLINLLCVCLQKYMIIQNNISIDYIFIIYIYHVQTFKRISQTVSRREDKNEASVFDTTVCCLLLSKCLFADNVSTTIFRCKWYNIKSFKRFWLIHFLFNVFPW